LTYRAVLIDFIFADSRNRREPGFGCTGGIYARLDRYQPPVFTFGLVSIPVRLFPATSPKNVRFKPASFQGNSRIQEKIFCPVEEKIIDRSELVRGYEIEKGRYVTFTDEELKKLEAQTDHAIEINEFIPVTEVDPIRFGEFVPARLRTDFGQGYHLLMAAMLKEQRVAIAKFTMRGKERLVLIRPYEDGLMLHTMYYNDEIRTFGEIDHGAKAPVAESELGLAQASHCRSHEKEIRRGAIQRIIIASA